MKPQVYLILIATLSLLLSGCWDRVEVEDQLFPVTIAIDKGAHHRYLVTAEVPIPSQVKAGVLGGQPAANAAKGIVSAESESIAQAMYIINASVARRITLRHLRTLIVGELLARQGMHDLLAELNRNGEIRQTAGFMVAKGSAGEIVKRARFIGDVNPAKRSEGTLMVERYLHLAPPIRLHHVTNRTANIGVDAFAPVVAINHQVEGEQGQARQDSAVAGDLARFDGNPVEIAGTAVFRHETLVGFLTVDETQALLALRGEMGKAYITFPDPFDPKHQLLARFHQENRPKYDLALSRQGPVANIRVVFEGEMLTGEENYRDPDVRNRVEGAARRYMETTMRTVLGKLRDWQADPVGIGLRMRGRFATFDEWARFNWRNQIPKLRVQTTVDMRIRRFGLTLGTQQPGR